MRPSSSESKSNDDDAAAAPTSNFTQASSSSARSVSSVTATAAAPVLAPPSAMPTTTAAAPAAIATMPPTSIPVASRIANTVTESTRRPSNNSSGSATPTGRSLVGTSNLSLGASSSSPRRGASAQSSMPLVQPTFSIDASASHSRRASSNAPQQGGTANTSSASTSNITRPAALATSTDSLSNLSAAPPTFGSPFGFLAGPSSSHRAPAPGSPAGTRASAATPVSSTGGYGSYWRAPAAPVFSNSSLSPSANAASSLQSFVPQYSTLGSRTGAGGYYNASAGAGSPRTGNNSQAAWGTTFNASSRLGYLHDSSAGLHSAPSNVNADSVNWPGNFAENTTFQENSVVSYTWNIRDVQLLREEVEKSPAPSEGGRSVSAGAGKSEVWTTQPVFGDGKWKLELVRTRRSRVGLPSEPLSEIVVEQTSSDSTDAKDQSREDDSAGTTVLSVYLTSLALSNVSTHLLQRAFIMLGIKPLQHWSGVHSHRSGTWLWRHFDAFDFTKENDYWECHQLPSLSELLDDSDVHSQDAFCLTVQIAFGPGIMPFVPGESLDSTPSTLDFRSTSTSASRSARLPFELPGALHVPRSLLSSLEALVDCAQTGDVRILVRERGIIRPRPCLGSPGAMHPLRVELYPVGAAVPPFEKDAEVSADRDGVEAEVDEEEAEHQIVVRDRVIWAHSAVLRARSEYFAHMLDSAFVEGRGGATSYGTYSYSDETLGRKQPSNYPPGARQIHTIRIPDSDFTTVYWLIRWLYLDEIEFARDEDFRGAAFDEDWMMGAQEASLGEVSKEMNPGESGARSADSAMGSAPTLAFPSPLDEPVWDWRTLKEIMPEDASENVLGPNTSASGLTTSRHILSERGSHGSSSSSLGASPSVLQQPPPQSTSPLRGWYTDPHPHPTPPASPSSSLATYRLAHRYLLPHLASLSSAHLVSSLTPRSAFPVLLATSLFENVHAGVVRYVFEHWEEVNGTEEFERCCDEVGRGEWGPLAGAALRVFMRSLVSPARVR